MGARINHSRKYALKTANKSHKVKFLLLRSIWLLRLLDVKEDWGEERKQAPSFYVGQYCCWRVCFSFSEVMDPFENVITDRSSFWTMSLCVKRWKILKTISGPFRSLAFSLICYFLDFFPFFITWMWGRYMTRSTLIFVSVATHGRNSIAMCWAH